MNWKLGVLLALTLSGCLRDLRPSELSAGISEESAARGRALLHRSADVHGYAAWQRYETTAVTLRDDWDSVMASMMGVHPGWDVEDRMQFQFTNGGFDGAYVFETGDRAGEVLGIQNWRTYDGNSAGRRTFHEEDDQDDDAYFMVPAVAFLLELPFRLRDVPVVAYLGEEERFGRMHHRVYASWSDEPSSEHDQFVVYIDAETFVQRAVVYTVREQFRFVRGTSTYTRHQRVGGVLVPSRMSVTPRLRNSHDTRFMHRMVLWGWRFDEVPVESLRPRADLGDGDIKPLEP